jgi:hypothetical protein
LIDPFFKPAPHAYEEWDDSFDQHDAFPQSANFIPNGDNPFYTRKRIVVGNVSKAIDHEAYSHAWMVYVTGTPSEPDVTPFVRKVCFHIHPDYAPNVVEVTEPPFQITRMGWGEFPIRVVVTFVDHKNRPKEMTHHLKLDKSGTQGIVPCGEEVYVLDLDKHTRLGPIRPHRALTPNDLPLRVVQEVPKEVVKEESDVEDPDALPRAFTNAVLLGAKERFPLYYATPDQRRKAKQTAAMNPPMYQMGDSLEDYLSFPPEKKLALQWKRAECVNRVVSKTFKSHGLQLQTSTMVKLLDRCKLSPDSYETAQLVYAVKPIDVDKAFKEIQVEEALMSPEELAKEQQGP